MKAFTHLQVREGSIINYNKHIVSESQKAILTLKLKSRTIGRKAYSGTITNNSKKRLRKAIQVLLQSSPKTTIYNPITKRQENFRLNFITLTLPNHEKFTDNKQYYNLLLKPFLQWLQKTMQVDKYVWKIELQKRNIIHWHIVTNVYIEYWKVKSKWNYLLRKNGLLKKFKEQYGHENPNSTDIHSVKEVDDMSAYLEKYISKNEQNQEELNCKIWDCSYQLKASKLFSVEICPQNIGLIQNAIIENNCHGIETDYFNIYYHKTFKPTTFLYGYQHYIYADWLSSINQLKLQHHLRRQHISQKLHDKKHIQAQQLSFFISNNNNNFVNEILN